MKSPVGMPGRAIMNPLMKRVADGEKVHHSPCHRCLAKCNPAEIPYCITYGLIEAVRGNIEKGLIFCGAGAWKAERIDTVREAVASLFALRKYSGIYYGALEIRKAAERRKADESKRND